MLATSFLWTALVGITSAAECLDPKYAVWPDHTACLTRSSYSGEPRGVSSDVAKAIVDQHNSLRTQTQPTAADMRLMVWDDEIARIAQKWADGCKYSHDKVRLIPGQFWLGQNLAYGYQDWSATIGAWYGEYRDFIYGSGGASANAVVGHYTQVVWSESSRIGCGYATCSNLPSPRYYVCNYGPAGNVVNSLSRPYRSGSACDSCPGRCRRSLCDCGGKACYNGGVLDLKTCQCRCAKGFHIGDLCRVNCSAAQDNKGFCDYYKKQGCSTIMNVQDECPIMCQVCNYDTGSTQAARRHASELAVVAFSLYVTHILGYSWLWSVLTVLI